MTLIIAGAVIVAAITVAFILYPVFRTSSIGRQYITDSVTGDRLAELMAQRDAVYEAIRDADFDLETGKLTEEDHRLMRERLTAEGVRLLQELDRLMQAEVREDLEREIEQEVAALRKTQPVEQERERVSRRPASGAAPRAATVDGATVACPSCGEDVRADAQFCTHCGHSLTFTCPECGTSVEPDDQFCSECGAALAPEGELVETAESGQ